MVTAEKMNGVQLENTITNEKQVTIMKEEVVIYSTVLSRNSFGMAYESHKFNNDSLQPGQHKRVTPKHKPQSVTATPYYSVNKKQRVTLDSNFTEFILFLQIHTI